MTQAVFIYKVAAFLLETLLVKEPEHPLVKDELLIKFQRDRFMMKSGLT